jgi:hypothetical protein
VVIIRRDDRLRREMDSGALARIEIGLRTSRWSDGGDVNQFTVVGADCVAGETGVGERSELRQSAEKRERDPLRSAS